MATPTDKPIDLTRKPTPALHIAPPPTAARGGIGVAPLVDIVFLLICFYLFVTQSIQAHEDPSIQLPVMTNSLVAVEQPAELVINVAADGAIGLNSQTVDLVALRDALTDQRRQATQRGQVLSVVVRIDRRQPYRRLDQVWAVCREVGLELPLLRFTETDMP